MQKTVEEPQIQFSETCLRRQWELLWSAVLKPLLVPETPVELWLSVVREALEVPEMLSRSRGCGGEHQGGRSTTKCQDAF